MNNKPIILLFEENELNISALYSLYAQNIPSKSAFWNRLSREEIAHAASIGSSTKENEYLEAIEENKFSRGVVKYVMDFVLEEIERAQKSTITHREALNTALRIEQSMLEKKCFEMFSPTKLSVKQIFKKLNQETERHVTALQKELDKTPL